MTEHRAKRTPGEEAQAKLLDACEQLMAHVKLLRDYATTPDNIWLARGELNKINEMGTEIDALLNEIKAGGDSS
ncbi:MAG TPA: hypothetical protein VF272_02435 [Candidatus Saccharimonadia bacterium]